MSEDLSQVGTLIQALGLVLLTVLSGVLAGTVPRDYCRLWGWAWGALAAALFALYFSFHCSAGFAQRALQTTYFVGENVFALLFLAGLRLFGKNQAVSRREAALALGAALLLALGLGVAPADFPWRFVFQAGLMGATFAAGLVVLWPLRGTTRSSSGYRVTMVGLSLLTLNFAQYVLVLTWAQQRAAVLPQVYRGYAPIYDLLLQVLLVFGTLMLTLEASRAELEQANRELTEAQQRLEALARQDALTSTLNRHAFDAIARHTVPPASGSMVLVDLDDLKLINDRFGHPAGDAAVRALAGAIRSLIRGSDQVFRWGGDEFLVVLPGLPVDEAEQRFGKLDRLLTAVPLPDGRGVIAVRASAGMTSLDGQPLEAAVERADAEMYRAKAARKQGTEPPRREERRRAKDP